MILVMRRPLPALGLMIARSLYGKTVASASMKTMSKRTRNVVETKLPA